jgi:outer membrane biosynthesis protein TonB
VAAPTKTAAVVAAGVLALGAGLGIATTAYADPTPVPIPTSAPTDVPDPQSPQTEPPGLPNNPADPNNPGVPNNPADPNNPGVPNNPADPNNPGGPTGEEALVEELSRMLGVDEETIRAGLEELRATYGPQLKAELEAQLDEAVRNGTLTQAEADALQRMIEEGVSNSLR